MEFYSIFNKIIQSFLFSVIHLIQIDIPRLKDNPKLLSMYEIHISSIKKQQYLFHVNK